MSAKLTVNNERLLDIVREAYKGKIVIPEFQRSFVWAREQIEEFLASLLQGYFVGSFLILETFSDNALVSFRLVEGVEECNPNNPNPKNHQTVRLVLDGQQRITSLFYALYAPENVKLSKSANPYRFYLKIPELVQGKIEEAVMGVSRRNRTELRKMGDEVKEFNAVEFTTLREAKLFYKWLDNAKSAAKLSTEDGEKIEKVYETLDKFQVPVVSVRNEGQEKDYKDVVVNIFERINRTGLRLSLFDLAVAVLYRKDIHLRSLWEEFCSGNKEISKYLNPESLLRVMALIDERGPREPKKGELLDFLDSITKEQFDELWENAKLGATEACKRLRAKYGAVESKLVPYTSMLVPLSALLWYLQGSSQTRPSKDYDKLDTWYWASVFFERYDSAANSKAYQDYCEVKAWIDNDEKIPQWLQNIRSRPDLDIDLNVGESQSAVYKGVLCLIASKGPEDPISGQAVVGQRKFDIDHIFPKSKYKEGSVLNLTFTCPKTNRKAGKSNMEPSVFLDKCIKNHQDNEQKVREIFEKHFITGEAFQALRENKLSAFLEAREKAILNELKSLIGIRGGAQLASDASHGDQREENAISEDFSKSSRSRTQEA